MEPTVRLCFGKEVGFSYELFYPFTLIIDDPFALGYKMFGMRAGIFFPPGVTTFGIDLRQIVAGKADYGVWTIFVYVEI